MYFAHGDELHETSEVSEDLLTTIGHYPLAVSLVLVTIVLVSLYFILGLFKLSFLTRCMLLVLFMIAIGIFYLGHNPAVTTIVLSIGFVAAFVIAFAQLSAGKPE